MTRPEARGAGAGRSLIRRIVGAQDALPARPRVLVAAVRCYLATAVANVVLTAVTDVELVVALGPLAARGKGVPTSAVVVLILVTGLVAVVYSLVLAVLALRLRNGGSNARPALLTVSLLSLFVIVVQGPALLIIPLLLVCAIVVTRRPITAWLRAARGLPPG